jgi:hypothetical protein
MRLLSLLVVSAACSRPLPDADSPQAQTYVRECGVCHPPIHPSVMTPAMWRIQVDRMDELRKRRGLPELVGREREVVIEYLEANAG